MKRPFVQVKTENLLPTLRAHMVRTLPRFTAVPGVAGITLNGGMSRGYADAGSEIDLTIYLTADAFRQWEAGRLPLIQHIVPIDGQLYDIKVIDIAAEMEAAWPEVARWDASYAEILYDPDGQVAELYRHKLTPPSEPASAGGHLWVAFFYIRLAAESWIGREDALQAHLMLNYAVEPLLKALYVANGEYVPHEKWLVHMSRSLNWKPAQWEERLAVALSADAASVESARRRQALLFALWEEIDRYLVETYFPGLPVHMDQKSHYDLLRWLAERGEVSLTEWAERARPAALNRAPFLACVTLEGDRVRLDRKRFEAVTPAELYAWHYEVLAAVREEMA